MTKENQFLKLQGLLFSIDIHLLCLYKSPLTMSLCFGEALGIFSDTVGSAVEQNSNIITSVMGTASHAHKQQEHLDFAIRYH